MKKEEMVDPVVEVAFSFDEILNKQRGCASMVTELAIVAMARVIQERWEARHQRHQAAGASAEDLAQGVQNREWTLSQAVARLRW